MDLDALFDAIVSDIEQDPEQRARSASRTSYVAKAELRDELRETAAVAVSVMKEGTSGAPYVKSIEIDEEGQIQNVRLRIYSSALKKKYHRTIQVSDGKLDEDVLREKANELAKQVREKEANQKSFEPEVGKIGKFLMEEKGYNRQTAWLHETYENRAEEVDVASLKDGDVGKVTGVESYNKTPFRFKVKFNFDPTNYDGEDGLRELAKQKAKEMYPNARVTDSFVKTGINYARTNLTID